MAAHELFGVDALPYGIFSVAGQAPRAGVRFGAAVVDLVAMADATGFELSGAFAQPTLNRFLALGRPSWTATREWVRQNLVGGAAEAQTIPLRDVELHLPIAVADYVDFYSSEHHAANVGQVFRPDDEPLLPNWKHLPVGYHGRSGTVVVSGTDIPRPCGQYRTPGAANPDFGPSRRLDIEAEVGFVVGLGSALGTPVRAAAVADHVFGVCLINDWSARDIQAWEYQPLGPFLGKSFATSMSAWVLPLDALEAARVPPPQRDHPLLDYLADDPAAPWGLDLALEVRLNDTVLSRPPFAGMYYTVAQQLAHLTVNGASLRTGDLFASGTVSGPEPSQRGSLLELTWNGAEPLQLDDGATRTFLQDGDTVTISATARSSQGGRLGLGEVTGTILPARC